MINADFCAAAVLISFGAVLGKTGPVQLLLMALLEVVLFGLNEFVLLSLLEVSLDGDGVRSGHGQALNREGMGQEWGKGLPLHLSPTSPGEGRRRLHDYPHFWRLLRADPLPGPL